MWINFDNINHNWTLLAPQYLHTYFCSYYSFLPVLAAMKTVGDGVHSYCNCGTVAIIVLCNSHKTKKKKKKDLKSYGPAANSYTVYLVGFYFSYLFVLNKMVSVFHIPQVYYYSGVIGFVDG